MKRVYLVQVEDFYAYEAHDKVDSVWSDKEKAQERADEILGGYVVTMKINKKGDEI